MEGNLENCLEFNGIITFNEFRKSHFYSIRKRGIYIFIVLATIYYVLSSYMEFKNALSISILSSGGVLVLYYLLNYIIVKSKFDKNPFIKFQQYYTIDSQGIFIKSKKGSLKLLWENIMNIHEYDDMFIIRISNVSILTMPKRYFDSDDDIKRFIDILLSNENKINRIVLK